MKSHFPTIALLFFGGLFACSRAGGASSIPRIVTHNVSETVFEATTACGQGPYAIEVPALGARYGEEIELHIESKHRVEFTVTLELGDSELVREKRMIGPKVAAEGALDNQRCLAEVAAATALGSSPGSSPASSGTLAQGDFGESDDDSFAYTKAPLFLRAIPGTKASGTEGPLLGFSWPEQTLKEHAIAANSTLRFRIWSMVPNDMQDVRFVVVHTKQAPNTSQAAYDAYLVSKQEERARVAKARQKKRLEAEILANARAEIKWEREAKKRQRKREREEKKLAAAELDLQVDVNVDSPPPTGSKKVKKKFTAAQLRNQERAREKQAAKRAKAEVLRKAKARRDEEKRIEDAERKVRKERRLALQAQAKLIFEVRAKARRKAYCDSHHESTKCWGVGGYKAQAKLKEMKARAEEFCLANPEQARCWTEATWQENRRLYELAYQNQNARDPGPPPAPLAEEIPPRFSLNSTWRAGYWEWASAQWVWLHGTWQVPQSDVDSGLTTQAPSAPPALKIESPSLSVSGSLVWVPGFWQWDGKGWIWVAGSYQTPPSLNATWLPANWAIRGSVHVLVPGGWKQ